MIATERLTLRPYMLSDHAAYLAMCSDPAVVRHLGGQPLSAEDAWNRLLRYAGHWSIFGHGLFAVFETASGRFVGETGFADFHRGLGARFDGGAEAAWVFVPDVHGTGYAYEAARAAHDWFVATQGISRTVCLIHADNAPSRRLAVRLGYADVATVDYRGAAYGMFERFG